MEGHDEAVTAEVQRILEAMKDAAQSYDASPSGFFERAESLEKSARDLVELARSRGLSRDEKREQERVRRLEQAQREREREKEEARLERESEERERRQMLAEETSLRAARKLKSKIRWNFF